MDVEFGPCDVCGHQTGLMRKYFYYPVKCECCNGPEDDHFEIVRHCPNCESKVVAPRKITAYVTARSGEKIS